MPRSSVVESVKGIEKQWKHIASTTAPFKERFVAEIEVGASYWSQKEVNFGKAVAANRLISCAKRTKSLPTVTA